MKNLISIITAFVILSFLASAFITPSVIAPSHPEVDSAKPDLIIDNVLVKQDGKEIDITVVIKNIGNADLTNWKGKLFYFDIKFDGGDKSAGYGGDYLQKEPLNLPSTKTLSFELPLAVPAENGTLDIKLKVDNYNDVVELNEFNNEFTYKTILTGTKKRVPPCGDYGDVNFDNFVSSADAELIANYLVGNTKLTEEQLRRADVNGDSKVSIADALMIAQYVEGLKIRKTFPVCSINKKPFLIGIYPPSGTIGTEITIIGSGFTPTDNTVRFGIGYIKNLKSDGTKIRFTVAEGFDLCAPGVIICPKLVYPKVLPDKYNISVINTNGESNTVSFTVTERGIIDIKPPTCDSYGDVNQDGKVSVADALLISQYVEGLKTLSDEQKLRADVDQDGGVTLIDAQHIADYLVGKRASFVACQKTPQCSSYGDVTGNGYVNLRDSDIIAKHLVGRLTLTQLQKSRADVNGDGNVTVADVLLIAQYIINGIKTLPVCENLEAPPEQLPPCGDYGDVDMDSYVNRRDSNILLDYLVGKLTLTQEQLRRADVTFDEKVTIADALLIAQYADGLRKTFPVCEWITETPPTTDWIDIALRLETLTTKFSLLKSVALAIANYYDSVEDITNKNKFTEIAGMFDIAKQKVENLEKFIKYNIDNIDAVKGKVKEEIKDLKSYLKQILLKILERPT